MPLRQGQISDVVVYVLGSGGFVCFVLLSFQLEVFQGTCLRGPWPEEMQAAMS